MSSPAAPHFTLLDQFGHPHSTREGDAEYFVLYFYPKDDTPGCTVEAKEFSEMHRDFKREGVQVYGISVGTTASKKSFCAKHDLTISLLADEDLAVSKSFGAYGKKSFMGRSFMGILRKTFILDKHRHIVKTFESVKPTGHALEVLVTVRELASERKLASLQATAAKTGKSLKRTSPRALRAQAQKSSRRHRAGKRTSSGRSRGQR